MTSLESTPMPEAIAEARDEERELLLGLICGALQEREIVVAAEFAAKIALCAKMSAGLAGEYGRLVKRVLIKQERILDIFPGEEIQRCILQFLRAIRRSRNDEETLAWLAGQFCEPQGPEEVRTYLIAVERVMANALIDGPRDCRKYGRV